jgi:dihydroflavonol-4-reductase
MRYNKIIQSLCTAGERRLILNMETVLVTGSTGFIGSRLCRLLIEQGYQVRAFHRATSRLQLLEGLPVEHVIGDLTRPETLTEALPGVDYVFHTASMLGGNARPGQMYTVNVEGTRSLLKAALQSGVKRMVFTSSAAALGVPDLPVAVSFDENHSWNFKAELWPYGYSKYLAELEVQKAVAEGLDAVIVNPALVFGPGDLYKQASSLIVQVSQKKVPYLLEGGLNVIHVDDVVAGHLAALTQGKTGERYLLGGENISVPNLIGLSADISHVAMPDNILPAWLARNLSAPLSLLQPFISAPISMSMLRLAGYYFYFDCHKAAKHLGWQPHFTAQQALNDAYLWFKEQDAI